MRLLFTVLMLFISQALLAADYKLEDVSRAQPNIDYYIDKNGEAVNGFVKKNINNITLASMYVENGLPSYITLYRGPGKFEVKPYDRAIFDELALYIPSIWPVQGRVSSSYGWRQSPFTAEDQLHRGIDIAVPANTDVIATADGTVTFADEKGGYGFMVEIDHHNGYQSIYAHNTSLTVKKGDSVKRGEIIARAGSTGKSTGSHVHYEVVVYGKSVNPRSYLP